MHVNVVYRVFKRHLELSSVWTNSYMGSHWRGSIP